MSEYAFPRLTDDAAAYWLAMDTWKPYDAAWLLCGFDPHGIEQSYGALATELCTQMRGDHPDSKAAFLVVELLKAASKAKRIVFPVPPCDVITWAKSKGLPLPMQFLDARCDSVPVAQGTGKKAVAKSSRKGGDRLTRAMSAGYDTLKRRHGIEPTCRALFDWLKDGDETGAIVEAQEDSLTFCRADGGFKDVTFEAFTDRFSRLPQRKIAR